MQQKRNDNDEFLLLPTLIAPELTAYMQLAAAVVTTVLGWISLTLEVFLRKGFGERYFSLMRVAMANAVMLAVAFVLGLLNGIAPDAGYYSPEPLAIIAVGFNVAAIFHLIWMWIRRWRNIPWHTRSFGENWLAFLFWRWDWTFYRFIEPVACFAVGYFLVKTMEEPIMGGWICLAAVALLMKNNISYYIQLERMWDFTDAQIEAANQQAAMRGERKSKTAGFSVVSVPEKMLQNVKPMYTAKTVSEAMRQAELTPSQSGD